MVESQRSIAAWAEHMFGQVNVPGLVARANEEMSELVTAAYDPGASSQEIATEAADVAIMLLQIVEALGYDLLQEVDAKMALNRGRRWTMTGTGGQHA